MTEEKITIRNVETEVKILELSKKPEEEKYERILEKADMELKQLIISKGLDSFQLIKKELESIKETRLDPNMLLRLGAKKRMKGERINTFIEKRIVELKEVNATEETIVKILAESIWPGNEDICLILATATTITQLESMVEVQKRKIEKRSTAYQEQKYTKENKIHKAI